MFLILILRLKYFNTFKKIANKILINRNKKQEEETSDIAI